LIENEPVRKVIETVDTLYREGMRQYLKTGRQIAEGERQFGKHLIQEGETAVDRKEGERRRIVHWLAREGAQGEGTQPPSLLSPPGPGSVTLWRQKCPTPPPC
jgi:hypothetical protein